MTKSMQRTKRIVVFVPFVLFACSSSEPKEPKATVEHRLEGACAHGICATGIALDATCDPCAALVCADDPWCCTNAWDATCASEVTSICGQSCTAPPPPDAGASTCAHPICAAGAALASTCDACVTTLCEKDAYCCGVEWDATCVAEVSSICGQSCN